MPGMHDGSAVTLWRGPHSAMHCLVHGLCGEHLRGLQTLSMALVADPWGSGDLEALATDRAADRGAPVAQARGSACGAYVGAGERDARGHVRVADPAGATTTSGTIRPGGGPYLPTVTRSLSWTRSLSPMPGTFLRSSTLLNGPFC